MGRFTVLLLIMVMAFMAPAQTVTTPDTLRVVIEDSIYKTVEVMPEFPGGEEGLKAYLKKTPYPQFQPRDGDIEGIPYIQFVIEQDGGASTIVIACSSGNPHLDKAAIEHIQAIPNWTPGYQNGKPVRVQYVVPVKFSLQ